MDDSNLIDKMLLELQTNIAIDKKGWKTLKEISSGTYGLYAEIENDDPNTWLIDYNGWVDKWVKSSQRYLGKFPDRIPFEGMVLEVLDEEGLMRVQCLDNKIRKINVQWLEMTSDDYREKFFGHRFGAI